MKRMGFDLSSDGGRDFRLNVSGWGAALRTAKANGWKPAGTVLDEEPGWDGDYYTNDGQYVTAEDALAMAQALDAATDPEWVQTLREFAAFLRESGGFKIH
jgi:hypothetical protein